MKKNKFLYPFQTPRIGEIINIPGSIYPVIHLVEKPIKSLNELKIPDKIFHYCNQQSFEGIIKTNSLWLSSLRNTNDELEILYFYQLFQHFIKNQHLTSQEIFNIYHLNRIYKFNLQNAFSTSFTTLKDVSWQWNEYGDNNKGFAIGFSTKKLTPEYYLPERTFFIKPPSLLKVDYNEKSHKKIIKTMLEGFLTKKYDIQDVALYLSKISCLCKTLKWNKEQEWRLLHFPLINTTIEQTLYESSSLIKINNNKYAYHFPSEAISDIIIGSKNSQSIEQVQQFLKIFYKKDCYQNINIYHSRQNINLKNF